VSTYDFEVYVSR